MAYETLALQGLRLASLALARRGEGTEADRWILAVIAGRFLVGAAVGTYFAANPQ